MNHSGSKSKLTLSQFTRSPLSIALFSKMAVASALFSSSSLVAQENEILEEEVISVGTRIAGRTAEDLPVPVDSLNADMLKRTGQTEVGRMLQQTAPSFNFSSSSISDGTDALRPATLRGLGPDQTLVLVNGKRRHQASLIHINTSVGRGTAGTDMNAIPAAAIDRIDILRDGAAAQYGSDAIAGVINIILKKDDSEGNLDVSYGEYSEGDGETLNINANKGFSFADDSGYVNITANYRDRGNSNRADPQGGCLYGGCVDTDGNGYLEPAPGNEDLEVNGPGRDGFRIGDADSEQFALVVSSGIEVGIGELNGFVTYSTRDNESGAFYRNPTGSNGVDNALLSDGLNPASTDGFLPIIFSEIEDLSFNIGYSMEFDNDSTLSVNYTTGENSIDYTTKNSANYSFANLLRFGQGLSDAEIRNTIPREAFAYGLELGLDTFNVDYTKQYDNFAIAAGAEWRQDSYKIKPGEEYSYFDYDTSPTTGAALFAQNAGGSIQGFNGISPESSVDESRDVMSLYIDGDWQVTDPWVISSAIRWDDYDGFGDTFNYKLASAFQVTESFKLRGSVSTGFRAPSMQQLFFNNISTQIRDAGAITVGTFRNDSQIVQDIGVPKLKEEESQNYSIGFVANLSSQWNLTVDYYLIEIEDRIAISNQLGADDDPGNITDGNGNIVTPGDLARELIDSNIGAAQFFLNGADTETKGFDIISTYSGIDLADGTLDITLAANFTETEVTEVFVPNSGALSTVSPDVVFSAQDISIIEEWQPEDRVSLSAVYLRDALSVNLAFNRYGEYTVLDSRKQTYSAEILTDLRISYELQEGLSLYFSGNNIFDVTPDEANNTTSRGGLFESSPGAQDLASDTVFRYSRRSAPFGFNGAYYSLGVSYDF